MGATPATASDGIEDLFATGSVGPSFAEPSPLVSQPVTTSPLGAQPFGIPAMNGGYPMPVPVTMAPSATSQQVAPPWPGSSTLASGPVFTDAAQTGASGVPGPSAFPSPCTVAPPLQPLPSTVAPSVTAVAPDGPAKLAGSSMDDFIANSVGDFSLTQSPSPSFEQKVAEVPKKEQGPIDIGDPFEIALGGKAS